MIESVGTASVQGASLRISPQAGSSYAISGAAAASIQSDLPKYGTRLAVRLDSAAQRAILEVRSSETGEVVSQYPSEAQMRAFQQAARLDTAQQQAAARQQATAQQSVDARPRAEAREAQQQQSQPQPSQQSIAPAPQAQAPRPNLQIAPSAPQVSAPAPETSSTSSAGEGVLV